MTRDFTNEEKKTESYRDIMEFMEVIQGKGVFLAKHFSQPDAPLLPLNFEEKRELALEFNSLPEWKVIEKRTNEALERQRKANERNKK